VADSRIRPSRRLAAVRPVDGPAQIAAVVAYGPDGHVDATVSDVDQLRALRAAYPVVWVDVAGHTDAALLEIVREALDMHPLAVEDVVNLGQRPKLEAYDENLFSVVRELHYDDGVLRSEQLSFFLGDGFVVTFQEEPGDGFGPVRERIRAGRGKLRREGADYLFYALIDALVDSYFPVLEQIGDRIEALEDAVLLDEQPDVVSPIHQARRELLVVRKSLVPLREALGRLVTIEASDGDETGGFVGSETKLYFRDVVDHLHRAIDLVDAYRDLSHSVMEAHLSLMSARLNDVIGFLTVISTTFIPLGFLASLWGMNFDPDASRWNMPELRHAYGYPIALLFMAFVGGAQLWYYHRRGWIRLRRRRATWKRLGEVTERRRAQADS
jgi:magnesium transporter